jgi:hypothetical protein
MGLPLSDLLSRALKEKTLASLNGKKRGNLEPPLLRNSAWKRNTFKPEPPNSPSPRNQQITWIRGEPS